MIPNGYQGEALTNFGRFLGRCHSLGGAKAAYEATVREWRDLPLSYYGLPAMPEVPYVCLRIPTGGGKTLIGGLAIAEVNNALLHASHSLTLWLVPTDAIREQTLKALHTRGSMLRTALLDRLGHFEALTVDEALYMQRATLDGGNVIVVSTMQSFKHTDTDKLNVYKQNGALMPHFEGLTDSTLIGNRSLVDAFKLRRPFIVVDEAHNQGTPLAFETLARLAPCAILELTATPDRVYQPSNVLFSVSAAALYAEDMIKLPIELATHPQWQTALQHAITCLDELQRDADAEAAGGGEQLRPIMLIQAERRTADQETFTAEKVKQALVGDFNIPAEQIAISTGAIDELSGHDIMAPDSRLRFIITVDKLREGWDCPWAYVLMSFRDSRSETAVEQILGRILRMPKARRKSREKLNRAYAFATSDNLAAIATNLRDGLVKAGFERQEASELITTHTPGMEDMFRPTFVPVPLPEIGGCIEMPDFTIVEETDRKRLAERIELSPETGSMTLRGEWKARDIEALKSAFKTSAAQKAVQELIEKAVKRLGNLATTKAKSPAESGERFTVPLLTYNQDGLFEVFDDSPALEAGWTPRDHPAHLNESEFSRDAQALARARLSLNDLEKIQLDNFERLDAQMALFERDQHFTLTELVSWLDRQLLDQTLDAGDKAAWILDSLSYLIKTRGFELSELVFRKFRLREVLEAKLTRIRIAAVGAQYKLLLKDENRFIVNNEHAVSFEQGRYVYDWRYNGFVDLKHHFFEDIGNLKDKGEEFECAEFIANQLEGLKWWVRNVERKPGAFWLQTATDRFYPDFVCQMEDGRTLVVEYKSETGWVAPDSEEKRAIGELWARRSSGRCLFVMPKGKDWAAIRNILR